MGKVKKLVYPMDYDEWLAHPKTKKKLADLKKIFARNNKELKEGKQLKINF